VLNTAKESSTRTAVIAGFVDLVVTVAALVAAQSSVLLADTLKTGLEFAAVMLAWLSIRRMMRQDGRHYEYGMSKLENLSAFVVAALMVIVVLIIAVNAIRNLIDPHRVEGVGVYISMAAQVVYGGINGFLALRSKRVAQTEQSPIMEAQAKLFLTKLVGNAFIFASLSLSLALAAKEWSVYIDPIASLVLAASIMMSAIGVFSSSVYDLLDGTLEEEDKLKIMRELVANFDRYDDLYAIRSRRAGNRAFIEIFLGFAPDKTVGSVQGEIAAIRASVAKAIRNASVTVIIGPPEGGAHAVPA
jgi:cation diffusion facilitator family transporter